VPNIPIANASTIDTTTEIGSTMHTTELGSSVGIDREWIPSIIALTYVEEGNYFIDWLNIM
jgi:hypothetical protein